MAKELKKLNLQLSSTHLGAVSVSLSQVEMDLKDADGPIFPFLLPFSLVPVLNRLTPYLLPFPILYEIAGAS